MSPRPRRQIIARARRLAAPVIGVIVVALVVALAILAPGMHDRVMELNDSGVWISSNSRGLNARANRAAGAFDASMSDVDLDWTDPSIDIFQDGNAVVGWSRSDSRLYAIDTRQVIMDEQVMPQTVGPLSAVAMGGGVLATISADSGEVRLSRYQTDQTPSLEGLSLEDHVWASLEVPSGREQGVAIAVDQTGRVFAASASGQTALISADGRVQNGDLGGELGAVAVSLVDGVGVVVDRSDGRVFIGDRLVQLDEGSSPRPQQASSSGDQLLVASTAGLTAIPLDGGDPQLIYARPGTTGSGSSDPAAPVVLNGTIYGAWAGQPGQVVRLADGQPRASQFPENGDALVTPVFRVNHGQILLNDMSTGATFDVDNQQSIDNWESVDPQNRGTDGDPQRNEEAIPQAQPDDLWARAGRASVLHVLDNDQNPAGSIMAITAIAGPDADRFTIAPDGQSLLVDVSADQTAGLQANYTVTNRSVVEDVNAESTEASSSADVTVSLRPEADNTVPNLVGHLGADPGVADYTVASASWLPITPGSNWRDADQDPLTVLSASSAGRSLPVSADGTISFSAPTVSGQAMQTVDYTVSDGRGDPVSASFTVNVLAPDSNQVVQPTAMSDMVRGVVGQEIIFAPLANDLPGADPLDRQAQLTLAAPVSQRLGLTCASDLRTGLVTVLADRVGSYFLDYTVAFGSGFAVGHIRIDIIDQDLLVAMPDQMTLRGTVPALSDVLVNDHDTTGSVLTVSQITPAEPDRLVAAVVQGRWIQVQMKSSVLDTRPSRIDYLVTNGRGAEVTGQLTVQPTAAVAANQTVTVVDDYVRVRIGDVTSIDVLANDAAESGEPLVINDNVEGLTAGQLLVRDLSAPDGQETTDVGYAWVDGTRIRYQAPESGVTARRLQIEYQAGVALGSPVSGRVWIDLVAEPADGGDLTNSIDQQGEAADQTAALSNNPPTPATIEARVIAGDSSQIPIDVYNQDPDGDSVVLAGLRTPPKYGRITAMGADNIVYQSYPDMENPGTDSFQIYLQDRFGAIGIGVVRVGTGAPVDLTAPLAMADTVTAQPGSDVTVFPITNDILPLGSAIPDIVIDDPAAPVEIDQEAHRADAVTPEIDAPSLAVSYHLSTSGVDGVSTTMTIRSQEGYLNPPNIFDQVADSVSAGVASVDVLEDAWDVDGPENALTITRVGAGASFDGSVVSAPVTDRGQVIPYVVQDGDGAEAMAVVFVPALNAGRPDLIDGGLIEMAADSSETVDLNDYIESPTDREVHLTQASQAWTTPERNLSLSVDSDQRVTLTSLNGYAGPAALTVEVRDTADATAADALTGVVTIPVQIGPATPVLWCPTTPITLVAGGNPRQVDVASFCHAWMPTTDGVAQLAFSGSWADGGDAIDLTGADGADLPAHLLQFQAGGEALPDAQSTCDITVDGFPEVTAQIFVKVVAATKPQLAVADITDVQQGQTVQAPVRITSPLQDSQPNVISVIQTSGPSAEISFTDQAISITPAGDAHGLLSFDVVGADVAADDRTDRQATDSFTVTVYGVPDAPTPPTPAAGLRSRAIQVSFNPGADNGSPILSYEVDWGAGTRSCGLNTLCEIPGLTNGQAYTVRARAQNKAGWGPWSEFGPAATPNALPGRVEDLAIDSVGCGILNLTWGDPAGEGTAPTAFHLSWTGANQLTQIGGGERSFAITGLDNNRVYTVTLLAENDAGLSAQPVTVTGQPSCKPLWPTEASLAIAAQNMGDTASIKVSWPAVDPQGPGPVRYQVKRSGGGADKTFAPTTELSLGDSGDEITYDGQDYTYTVTATNASGGAEHTSSAISSSWTAIGSPAPWSSVGGAAALSVKPTGVDNELAITVVDFPNFRDASGYVQVIFAGHEIARLTPGAPTTVDIFVNGIDILLQFSACNSVGSCNTPQNYTATRGAFGPMPTPSLSLSVNNADQVCYTVRAGSGGRKATLTLTSDHGDPQMSRQLIDTDANTNFTGCFASGVFERPVTVTAKVVSEATDPGRPSVSVSEKITTLAGRPDDFAAGSVHLTPTGVDNQLRLTIDKVPDPKGQSAIVSISINNYHWSATPGSSFSQVFDATANGESFTYQVTLSNGKSSNTAAYVTAAPFGPLSKAPTITTRVGDGQNVCASVTGNANGAPARIDLTLPGGEVRHGGVGSGDLTFPEVCLSAGAWEKLVAFSAQVVSEATTPSRPASPKANASVTSAVGVPDEFDDGAVWVTPTGRSGQATLGIAKAPMPNGGALEMFYSVAGGPAQSLGHVSGSWTIDGLTDGEPTQVKVWASNGTNANTGVTLTAKTWGPLPVPVLTPIVGQGTTACVNIEDYNSAGGSVVIALVAKGQTFYEWNMNGVSGGNAGHCFDIGAYATAVSITATATDTSGLGRATVTGKAVTATSGPLPKMTVTWDGGWEMATAQWRGDSNVRVCRWAHFNTGGVTGKLIVVARGSNGGGSDVSFEGQVSGEGSKQACAVLSPGESANVQAILTSDVADVAAVQITDTWTGTESDWWRLSASWAGGTDSSGDHPLSLTVSGNSTAVNCWIYTRPVANTPLPNTTDYSSWRFSIPAGGGTISTATSGAPDKKSGTADDDHNGYFSSPLSGFWSCHDANGVPSGPRADFFLS
ncbi:MAG: hypothetical protein LBV30_10995 [Propionibacteriaceae bacterium]|jgi:hypothetical protein|nr:hypothetical protein [Propionibacteriaceae bacterium]